MNHRIQNYLGIAIIAGVLMVGISAMSYASYYGKSIEPSSFRSFAASGEGKAIGIPDVAQFNFSVITEGGTDIAKLQKENTDKVNKIIAFVKSEGVEAKDIETQNYDLNPRYQNYTCGPIIYREGDVVYPSGAGDSTSISMPSKVCPPPAIVGYTITQSVSVKVRDFSKIGEILSGVVANGANSTSGLSFRIDDPTELQNEARAEAIEKAKAKAKSIAKAGGFRLGRLLSIDEGGYYPYQTYEKYGRGGAIDTAMAPALTIEPGSEDIIVTVTLRYEID